MIKSCKNCKDRFKVPMCHKRALFCSVRCKNESPLFGKIMSKSRKGIKFSKKHLKNLSISHIGVQKGKKNGMWKGNKVGYVSLHKWVARQLGQPRLCEHCRTTKKQMYHWANKSGKYLRKLTDWIRLCVKCHKAYDRK